VRVGCVTTDFAMQVSGLGTGQPWAVCGACHRQWSYGGLGICIELLLCTAAFPGPRNFTCDFW
jgi:hypothetical protein